MGAVDAIKVCQDLPFGLDLVGLAHDGTAGNILYRTFEHSTLFGGFCFNTPNFTSITAANFFDEKPVLVLSADTFCHALIIKELAMWVKCKILLLMEAYDLIELAGKPRQIPLKNLYYGTIHLTETAMKAMILVGRLT